jgi:serine/threonine-protein kinase HipA
MVRNGDAHLKNFGLLYRSREDVWLAPMFDVVTTAIYRYTQSPGGPELEDRTLALKLFAGRHRTKSYPTTDELVEFGRRVCGVTQPALVLARIADAMGRTLEDAKQDARVPPALLASMALAWEQGLAYAR